MTEDPVAICKAAGAAAKERYAGKDVAGTITVGGGERVVTFAPKDPWARGAYKLVVDARLEDVCGNRVGVPFEVDVFHPIPLKPMVKLTERAFSVK